MSSLILFAKKNNFDFTTIRAKLLDMKALPAMDDENAFCFPKISDQLKLEFRLADRYKEGHFAHTSPITDIEPAKIPPSLHIAVNWTDTHDAKLRTFTLWLLDTYECEGINYYSEKLPSSAACKEWVEQWLP